jgi:hypothetical protein
LKGGIELRKPDVNRLKEFTGPTAIARAANDPEMLQHCVSVVEDWCQQTEALLLETQKDSEDAGNFSMINFSATL